MANRHDDLSDVDSIRVMDWSISTSSPVVNPEDRA